MSLSNRGLPWLATVLLIGTMTMASYGIPAPRIVIPFNDGWKFIKGDQPGAAATGYDDARWSTVSLPHTWDAEERTAAAEPYYRGPAWYRKSFTLPAPDGKRMVLRFGAVNMIAEVYVNGARVGEHKGGYAAFAFDITPFVRKSGDNTLAVKVDNSAYEKDDRFHLAPLSADFTMFGGIHRTVEMILTSPVHIEVAEHAAPGVAIAQDHVSDTTAACTVVTALRNDLDLAQTVDVIMTVRDGDRNLVRKLSGSTRIPAHSSATAHQALTIDHPHLWDGRHDPYLYSVSVSVHQGNALLDSVMQPLGLRSYLIDPDRGFFLNGKPYRLCGFNRHEDRQNRGRAVTDADREEDMRYVLDIGATMVRFAHYQHADKMYELCDRYGIIAWAEVPLVNAIAADEGFRQNAQQQLMELIRQNINHPSIVVWSIANEVYNVKGPDPLPLLRELHALAKAEDPTRLTTLASNFDTSGTWVPDVVGLNFYPGWYHGEARELGGMLDGVHAKHPGRAIGVAEYGAGASVFQHEEHAAKPLHNGRWHPEEYQATAHEQFWKDISQRPYLWMSTVWVGFDFASDFRREGFADGINDKGLVSRDRNTPKDAYYWYRVNWNPLPQVHITGKRFTERDTSLVAVKVYANTEDVELFVNGTSLGRKHAPDHVHIWDTVTLSQGTNTIKAVGNLGRKQVVDQCWWHRK